MTLLKIVVLVTCVELWSFSFVYLVGHLPSCPDGCNVIPSVVVTCYQLMLG